MGPSNLLSWRDWVNYFYSGQFVDEIKTALTGIVSGAMAWAVTLGLGLIAYLGYKRRIGGAFAKWLLFVPVMFIAAFRVVHTLYRKFSPGQSETGNTIEV